MNWSASSVAVDGEPVGRAELLDGGDAVGDRGVPEAGRLREDQHPGQRGGRLAAGPRAARAAPPRRRCARRLRCRVDCSCGGADGRRRGWPADVGGRRSGQGPVLRAGAVAVVDLQLAPIGGVGGGDVEALVGLRVAQAAVGARRPTAGRRCRCTSRGGSACRWRYRWPARPCTCRQRRGWCRRCRPSRSGWAPRCSPRSGCLVPSAVARAVDVDALAQRPDRPGPRLRRAARRADARAR